MDKSIIDIHAPNTINLLLENKIVLPDNFINLAIDKQKKDLKNICKENNLKPIYKVQEKKQRNLFENKS